jgi:hypothetical protein
LSFELIPFQNAPQGSSNEWHAGLKLDRRHRAKPDSCRRISNSLVSSGISIPCTRAIPEGRGGTAGGAIDPIRVALDAALARAAELDARPAWRGTRLASILIQSSGIGILDTVIEHASHQ